MPDQYDKLYWESPGEHKPLSRKLFNVCHLHIYTQAQFEAIEKESKGIKDSIEAQWATENPGKKASDRQLLKGWHETDYTRDKLMTRGYKVVTDGLIVAVDDGKGGLAIKVVYYPDAGAAAASALELAKYAFDGDRCKTNDCVGQSVVSVRGNKAQVGRMLMYGSTNQYGVHANNYSNNTVPEFTCVYKPNGKLDASLLSLVSEHADAMSALEKGVIPGYWNQRKRMMERLDPQGQHRITPNAYGTGLSLSSSYAVGIHDDSGKGCEFIVFVNRNGPLPIGHTWCFVAAGFLFALPEVVGDSALIMVKGNGVHHGTLPTSSTGPTIAHGNIGTALVSPAHTIKQMERQLVKRTTADCVGVRFTAAHMYAQRDLDIGWTCVKCQSFHGTYCDVVAHEKVCAAIPTPTQPRVTAHAFWTDSALGAASLPDYGVVGLQTAVRQFDEVVLWTYGPIANTPSGVEMGDATQLLPFDMAQALVAKNIPLAHVADVVRFAAACQAGGWVIDVDNLWLRRPPSGMTFTTLYAKRTGGVAPSCAKWKAMAASFAKGVWDGGDSINTPFCVEAGTPFATALHNLVQTFLDKQVDGPTWPTPPTKDQWNKLMWGLRDLIVKHGLGTHVRPPIEYGVSPYWHGFTDVILRDGYFDQPADQRLKFGVQLPSTREILTTAVCIPTSFVLAERHNSGHDIHAIVRDRPTSLLARVMTQALSNKRKGAPA